MLFLFLMIDYVRAETDAAAARLMAEAEVLRACAVPGIATLRSIERGADGSVRLVTSLPPGVALTDRLPVTSDEAAGICLAVIAILSDVSTAQVFHGRLSADDIHLTDAGQVVLRALPGARPARGLSEVVAGGASERGLPVVRDLGDLLARMLPAPTRSRWRLGSGDPAAALRLVALRAADPAVGLTRLATLIRGACPDACLPSDPRAPDPDRQRQRPRPAVARRAWSRRRAAALASTALVGTMSAAAAMLSGSNTTAPRSPAGTIAEGGRATDHTDPTTHPTGPGATAVWPRPQCPPVVPPLRDEGGGCPVELRATDLEVSAGARRWRVGGPGDYRLAVGDGDCTGRPTTVVLDVVAGTVWLFSDLPADGQPRSATIVGHATGAVALVPPPGGCGAFSARDSTGAVVAVVRAGTEATAGETGGKDRDADAPTEEQG